LLGHTKLESTVRYLGIEVETHWRSRNRQRYRLLSTKSVSTLFERGDSHKASRAPLVHYRLQRCSCHCPAMSRNEVLCR
jgi:hypothetical protein